MAIQFEYFKNTFFIRDGMNALKKGFFRFTKNMWDNAGTTKEPIQQTTIKQKFL